MLWHLTVTVTVMAHLSGFFFSSTVDFFLPQCNLWGEMNEWESSLDMSGLVLYCRPMWFAFDIGMTGRWSGVGTRTEQLDVQLEGTVRAAQNKQTRKKKKKRSYISQPLHPPNRKNLHFIYLFIHFFLRARDVLCTRRSVGDNHHILTINIIILFPDGHFFDLHKNKLNRKKKHISKT